MTTAPGRQVIASVPMGHALFGLAIGPLLYAVLVYFLYIYFTQDDLSLYERWAIPSMTVTALAGLPLAIRYYRRLLSGKRDVVWLEDGQVIFVHPDQFSVRCGDVADIKSDFDDSGWPEAVFTLKDGSRKTFRVQGLDHPGYAIVARLREGCGLPEDPQAWKPPA